MNNGVCPTCGRMGITRIEPRRTLSLATEEEIRWWVENGSNIGRKRNPETVRFNINLGKRIGTYDPKGAYRPRLVHG